jgi:hypothetical protein
LIASVIFAIGEATSEGKLKIKVNPISMQTVSIIVMIVFAFSADFCAAWFFLSMACRFYLHDLVDIASDQYKQ